MSRSMSHILLSVFVILLGIHSVSAVKSQSKLMAKYLNTGMTHNGMSTTEFNNALIALREEEEAAEEGALPQCGGLVAQFCKPCPDGGSEEFCKMLEDECSRIFCNPMCKRTTWTCKIEFGELAAESSDQERFQDALCANFVNEGCSKVLDCCPQDDFLLQDVEDKVFRDNVPLPSLPTPSCFHHPGNAEHSQQVCTTCNENVKIALEKRECNFPASPSFLETGVDAKAAAFASVYGEKGSLTLEEMYAIDEALLADIESGRTAAGLSRKDKLTSLLQTGTKATVSVAAQVDTEIEESMDAEAEAEVDAEVDAEAEAEAEAEVEAEAEAEAEAEEGEGEGEGETPENNPHPNEGRFGDKVDQFPGKATYFSMQTRCNALATRVEGMFATLQEQFQEKLCNCMGCCVAVEEPVCFFPVTTVIAQPPELADAGESAFLFFLEHKTTVQENVLRNLPRPQVTIRPPQYWAERRKLSPWYQAKMAKKTKSEQ